MFASHGPGKAASVGPLHVALRQHDCALVTERQDSNAAVRIENLAIACVQQVKAYLKQRERQDPKHIALKKLTLRTRS